MTDLTSALKAEDRADLVNALKDLSGRHSDVLEALTATVRKRVDVLREIQSQHDELEAKLFEERAALEAKYQKLYQPLYTKRYEIINGDVEVPDSPTEQAGKEDRGVPGFWLAALKNNEVLEEEISERDEEALKYLKDIKWSRTDDHKGFKLEFLFQSNPYFKNSVLTKIYHMIDKVDKEEPILEKAIGTEIEWYPGKCLTQKILNKKPRKGWNAKPIINIEQCESFFNIFSPPQVPEHEPEFDDDIEDWTSELQNLMEEDYKIGSAIRDKIIPHAVSWFTGEAVQYEKYENDLDDHELDDIDETEDEEDNEEDDDDDDEEDRAIQKKRRVQ